MNLAPQVGLEPTTLRLTAEMERKAMRSCARNFLKNERGRSPAGGRLRITSESSSYRKSDRHDLRNIVQYIRRQHGFKLQDLGIRALAGCNRLVGETDQGAEVVVQVASAHEPSHALAEFQQTFRHQVGKCLVGGCAAHLVAIAYLALG